MRRLPMLLASFAFLAIARPLCSHETESLFRLALPQGEVHGTKLIPHIHRPVPGVVILGGALSQDRDGRLLDGPSPADKRPPSRDALQRLAEALQAGGYGSLRYDRVGFGRSRPSAKWTGTFADEAAVAAAVIEQARGSRDFSQVIVMGESDGAYVASLAAKSGTQADGYVLLGALCGSSESMYAYNVGQLVAYADSSPQRLAWASATVPYQLALGRHYPAMLAAAAEGHNEYRADDQGFAFQIGGLERRREQLSLPPDAALKHLRGPVFALAGSADRHVPPEHAAQIVAVLKQAGNREATSQTIAGVDHSFQKAAPSEDEQIREGFELTSFRRPYQAKAYHAILDWLYKRFPTPAEGHPEQVEQVAARATELSQGDKSQ